MPGGRHGASRMLKREETAWLPTLDVASSSRSPAPITAVTDSAAGITDPSGANVHHERSGVAGPLSASVTAAGERPATSSSSSPTQKTCCKRVSRHDVLKPLDSAST